MQEQGHLHLGRAERPRQRPERCLVLIGRGSVRELVRQLLGQLAAKSGGGPIVDPEPLLAPAGEVLPELVLGHLLHPNQDPARPILRCPPVDQRTHAPPPAEIDVADAEVRPGGEREGLLQGRKELGARREVIEDSRHGVGAVAGNRWAEVSRTHPSCTGRGVWATRPEVEPDPHLTLGVGGNHDVSAMVTLPNRAEARLWKGIRSWSLRRIVAEVRRA